MNRSDNTRRYCLPIALLWAMATGTGCGSTQQDRPPEVEVNIWLGSENQTEVPSSSATGNELVVPPGRFGPPPTIPLDEIRWFFADSRGLIVGRLLDALGLEVPAEGGAELVTVDTYPYGELVTYRGVDWASARQRASFLRVEWNTNHLAVAGLVEPDESANVQELVAAYPGTSMDDVDALTANVLGTGVSSLGSIVRIEFGAEVVTLTWHDLLECGRTTMEFEPVFALLPEGRESPDSAVLIYEFDDRLCSIAFQASDRRLAFVIEDGCTGHPSTEMLYFSGGLAPTQVAEYPLFYACGD